MAVCLHHHAEPAPSGVAQPLCARDPQALPERVQTLIPPRHRGQPADALLQGARPADPVPLCDGGGGSYVSRPGARAGRPRPLQPDQDHRKLRPCLQRGAAGALQSAVAGVYSIAGCEEIIHLYDFLGGRLNKSPKV